MSYNYNYLSAMFDDVKQYIDEVYEEGSDFRSSAPTRDEVEQTMNEVLWDYDGVTGNGSGSYTFNRWQAAQYVTEDGSRWLEEAVSEGFVTEEQIGKWVIGDDWESIDVTIRCFLLPRVISDVLDEMEKDGVWDE